MEQPGEKKRSAVYLLLAFLLPAAVFLLILLHYRIIPFGETTLLFSDLDSQYIEFMAEYRRVLLGQGSLFYSWHAGLGMNFIALIAYYLASPFNFLLVLFPENGLPLAVSVLTTLKLGCAGLAFACFLRERYRHSGDLIPLFSAFYALSAFALGYAFNIMWLDALIWLPLICAGIERLIFGRKHAMSLLICLYALSFLSQFYMAWMTGFFSAVYFLAQLFMRKIKSRNWILLILCFGVSVGVAAGLSAFLLVPTFFVLKNNMGLMGQEFPPLSGSFEFIRIFSKLFIGSFDGIKNCLPHIYCGLPALIGTALYFTRKSIPVKEKVISGIIGGFLLFSFWFQPLDFILHAMDHPSWFPYRYAFLFVFWMLGCAYEGFVQTTSGKIPVFSAAVWLVPLILSAFLFEHSAGWFLPLNLLFLAAYIVCGAIPDRGMRYLFTVCCFAELLISSGMLIGSFSNGYTMIDNYRSFHEHYRALAESVMPGDTDFYRMEKTMSRNYNDPLGIGFPGVSHFSSTASSRQSEFLKRLGFNCYATWCTYQGATPATDALLRIRYEFGENGKTGSTPSGTEVWEHNAVFPLFFFAEEDFARFDLFSDLDSPIDRQNSLLRILNEQDDENYFEEIPAEIIQVSNLQQANDGIYYRVESGQAAFIDYRIYMDPHLSTCIFVPKASLNYNVYVDSTLVINANRDYAPFPICLDSYTNGETAIVRVETTKDYLKDGLFSYSLDPIRLQTLVEEINADAPMTERISETGFRLQMDPADEERLVVSSIPFDAGWQVKAYGKPLEVKMIHESMLGFILPAECGEAIVSYQPYGWNIGAWMSILSVILLAGVFIIEKRRKTESAV